MLHDQNHIGTWNDIISVDAILREYQKEKIKTLSMLRDNPKLLVNLLNQSRPVLCQDLLRCEDCENVLQINPTKKIGEPFQVDNGSTVGDYFLYQQTKITRTLAKLEMHKFIANPFIIKTLVTWVIEEEFKKAQCPHALVLLMSYMCHDWGHQLYKVPVIDAQLCPFDCAIEFVHGSDSLGILMQCVVIFDVLKTLKYNHPSPTLNIFLFSNKPCSYKYKNQCIQSAYTLTLSDFGKVNVTYQNIVLQSDTIKYTLIQNAPSKKLLETKNNQFRIHPHPLFNWEDVKQLIPTVLEFYTVLIAMIKDATFGPLVMNNPEAFNLITKWLPDIDIIKNQSTEEVLKTIWLHRDPTEIMFQ